MMMKLKIDKYSFGRMTIGGREFTSDLIIHPDGSIEDNWWRAQGHTLHPDDITTVLNTNPEKLVVGTGASGLMRVSQSVTELCEMRGINVEVYRTDTAVTRFNKAVEMGTVVAACFHLTC
jgi:hypothetical protein